MSIKKKTATLVKIHPTRVDSSVYRYGAAAIYQLSEPYVYGWEQEKTCSFMFVSTSIVLGEPETYAFAAEESDNVLSWSELDGSEKGNATHEKVLANMGYTLTKAVA